MVKRKEDEKICMNCSEYVNLKKDHHVQIHTLNRVQKPDDHAYFHFECWVDYFNARVQNKMNANIRFMQEKAVGLFNSPQIKELLEQVSGSGMALNMLNTPLKDKFVPKKTVISKIQNDRKRKRSGKKRKTQMQKV